MALSGRIAVGVHVFALRLEAPGFGLTMQRFTSWVGFTGTRGIACAGGQALTWRTGVLPLQTAFKGLCMAPPPHLLV